MLFRVPTRALRFSSNSHLTRRTLTTTSSLRIRSNCPSPSLFLTRPLPLQATTPLSTPPSTFFPATRRKYSTPTTLDSIMEAITDQYGTAYDEFSIASEETEKKTVYASDDRAAAVEEFDKLKTMYDEAIRGEFGEEVKRRVGNRVRELERAMEELERKGTED